MLPPESSQPRPEVDAAPEAAPTPEVAEVDERKHTRLAELKARKMRKEAISSSLRPIFKLSEAKELDIRKLLRPWAKKFGETEENIEQILATIDWGKEVIGEEFSPEERIEIVCRLTEIVERGHLSTEMMSDLITIVRKPVEGEELDPEGVGFYRHSDREIIITDGFFAKNEDGKYKYDTAGMINHEVAHGVADHSGLYGQESRRALEVAFNSKSKEAVEKRPELLAVFEIIEAAEESYDFQSQRIQKYLDRLRELQDQPVGQTPKEKEERHEEIIRLKMFLANEIMGDRIGVFLESDGSLEGFIITATAKLTRETREKVKSDEDLKARFLAHCQTFYKFISEGLADKIALAEKISSSTLESDFDEEFDFWGYGDSSLPTSEPGTSDRSGDPGFWEDARSLVDAIGEEIGGTLPIKALENPQAPTVK